MVSKIKPPDISTLYLAVLIAKYYFHNCSSYNELTDMVQSKLLEFHIPNYQEYRYHQKIENVCKELFESGDASFKERDFIPIYEHEMEVIESLDSDRKKKLMFTLFALARYMDCDGWINKKTSRDISEVFKIANVYVTSEGKNEILHELYCDHYISLAKRIDNLNIHVNLDDSGEIIYRVTDFTNLGFQYIGNFKKGYRQCVLCGRAIKAKNNSQKYCSKCAKIVQQTQRREWSKTARKR